MGNDDIVWLIITMLAGILTIFVAIMATGCVSVEVTHYTTIYAVDNETAVEGSYEAACP